MRENNDFARRRLTHFLAARLKARHREMTKAERANPSICSATRSRSDQNSGLIAEKVDSSSRATPPSEQERDITSRVGSSK
jgi:hypothetical protein